MEVSKVCRSLDGEWELYIAEHHACRLVADAICTARELEAQAFLKIKGRVPGNFEFDLCRAGLLPDLYVGDNVLLAQRLENRYLWYVTDLIWMRWSEMRIGNWNLMGSIPLRRSF